MSKTPTPAPRIGDEASETRMPWLYEADVSSNRKWLWTTIAALGVAVGGGVAGVKGIQERYSDEARETTLNLKDTVDYQLYGIIPHATDSYCWNYGKDNNEYKARLNYWLYPDNINRNVWMSPSGKVGSRSAGADFLLKMYEISTFEDVRSCLEERVPGLKLTP